VVQAALDISSLSTTATSLSADDPFWIRVGLPNAARTALNALQPPRAGAPLTVTITNSNPAVAQLVTTALTGQQVTVTLPAGQLNSATTVAQGGVALHALGSGSSTVSATIPGFLSTTAAAPTVTVDAPTISLSSFPTTIGAGLQVENFSANLAAAQHGGVTVHIASSNPAVALVSANDTTAGSASIDVFVANGFSTASFVVQGVENAPVPATVTITASAAGFTNVSGTATVVQPALRIVGLTASTAAAAADDPFQVQIGVPNVNRTDLVAVQVIRAGGTPLTVTVANSNAAVAQLRTSTGTAQTATVTIAVRQSSSPTSVVTGGVALDPLTPGQTTVSASIPGFVVTNAGSVAVTISP